MNSICDLYSRHFRFLFNASFLLLLITTYVLCNIASQYDHFHKTYTDYLNSTLTCENKDDFVRCIILKLEEEEIALRFSSSTKNDTNKLIEEFERYFSEVSKICPQCKSNGEQPAKSSPTQTSKPDVDELPEHTGSNEEAPHSEASDDRLTWKITFSIAVVETIYYRFWSRIVLS